MRRGGSAGPQGECPGCDGSGGVDCALCLGRVASGAGDLCPVGLDLQPEARESDDGDNLKFGLRAGQSVDPVACGAVSGHHIALVERQLRLRGAQHALGPLHTLSSAGR
jgi:hypothetical protein